MFIKLKKILTYLGVDKIYSKLYNWYDDATCKIVECSIGDILLLRDTPNESQILLTSRLLDVEAYIENGDESFHYQNMISRKKYGEKHNEVGGNQSFKALIESYKQNGYKKDSFITCDRNVVLMDGNHRMGLQIFEKIELVSARIVKRIWPNSNSIDGYYTSQFATDFMERIFDRYQQIQRWLIDSGMTFCAYINADSRKGVDLKQDLTRLCNVLSVKQAKERGVVLCFSMKDPQYTVKNNQLFSQRAYAIEQIMKRRSESSDIIIVSKNCLEGRILYQQYVR